ncbi:MAG: TIGR01777 family protein [Chthoniobacterales bacterium]|nr:TIGR01777 family protein [Chthoniobacterales bacterium]
MRLGITGAAGFIGSRVSALAAARGWEVVPFSRTPRDSPGRRFSLEREADVEGLDAVVHLAGEPVFGLWTAAKRRRIMESRVLGTRRVVEGFAAARNPPRVLVSGSAVGIYGDTRDDTATEASPPGRGFLAEVTTAWEAEAVKARNARVVLLRTGFAMGRGGGAMKLLLPLFRAGLGGRLGNGRQWMSCIHVDDVAGMVLWAVESAGVQGPLNAVMPAPVTNAEFTRALARAVRRPAILPVPALVLRVLLGRLSAMLLGSSRVLPEAARRGGYVFAFPDVPSALADVAGN